MSKEIIFNYYDQVLKGRWKKTNIDLSRLYTYALKHTDKREYFYDIQHIPQSI